MTNTHHSSSTLKARPPIRCLIVQLARLGDTLQTLMALRAAKQLYPQLEFTLVVRDSFSAAAHRVPWVHEVHELPTGALIGDVVSGKTSEQDAIPALARWISPLVSKPWDFAINWTYSEASSWLTGLLPAKVKLGFSRRKDQTLSASDGWTHYMQGVVQGQLPQNIHLTDILTTQFLTALQIHIGDPEADAGNTSVSRGFFDFSQESFKFGHPQLQSKIWRDPARKWIAFQIGAGHPSKTLSPQKWADLIRNFREKRPELNLLILGGRGETAQQAEIKSLLSSAEVSLSGVAFLAGESDFENWASLIERSQWLLSGDTAAIHLASIVGTRVLNLSLGNVRYMETGPYGNGHVVARWNSPDSFSAGLLFDAWEYISSDFRAQKSLTLSLHLETEGHSPSQIESLQLYKSRIRDADSGGGVCYEPLLHEKLSFDEWQSQVAGYIARSWYCGWTPPIGHELNRNQVKADLLREVRQLAEPIDVLIKICEESKRTALSLQRKVGALRSQKIMGLESRAALQEQAGKLMELEKLIERLVFAQPALGMFYRLAKVSMHNLSGEDIAELGKQTASVYHRLSQGAQFYKDWVSHLLTLSKPRIVENTARVIPVEFKNSSKTKPENEVTP
jgi:ADP-heptose:LPS heptosyltransferase